MKRAISAFNTQDDFKRNRHRIDMTRLYCKKRAEGIT